MKNNILHKFSKGVIACLAAVSLCACHDEFEDMGVPTLSVTPESKELVFTETSSQTITISTNRDWKAYLETPKDWLELSKTQGSGNGSIILTAAAGAKTESATLVIALYNQYGVMMSESISITRNGDGSVNSFEFDYASALTSSWQNGVTVAANGVNWYIYGMNTSTYGNIGFSYYNSINGHIYNQSALGTSITEVVVDLQSDDDFGSIAVYAGSAANPSTDAEEITGVLSGGVATFTIPSGCPYFRLVNTYEGYLNIDGFEVTYDGEISDDTTTGGGDETGGETGGETQTTVELYALTYSTLGISTSTASSGSMTIDGVEWSFANVSKDSSYDTIYIDLETLGYITNTTELSGKETSFIIYGSSYIPTNLVVTVGDTADPTTVLTSTGYTGSSWDCYHSYTIPSGTKYIKFAANTSGSYDASLTSITFSGVEE